MPNARQPASGCARRRRASPCSGRQPNAGSHPRPTIPGVNRYGVSRLSGSVRRHLWCASAAALRFSNPQSAGNLTLVPSGEPSQLPKPVSRQRRVAVRNRLRSDVRSRRNRHSAVHRRRDEARTFPTKGADSSDIAAFTSCPDRASNQRPFRFADYRGIPRTRVPRRYMRCSPQRSLPGQQR